MPLLSPFLSLCLSLFPCPCPYLCPYDPCPFLFLSPVFPSPSLPPRPLQCHTLEDFQNATIDAKKII